MQICEYLIVYISCTLGGGLSIMKTIVRKTAKKQFKLKYRNQSKEQTLV